MTITNISKNKYLNLTLSINENDYYRDVIAAPPVTYTDTAPL